MKLRDATGAGASHESGFTLIEIMIALAILGTALFVLLEAHYSALSLFSDAKDMVDRNELMARLVGQAEVEVLAGSMGDEGDFGERYPEYSYSYTATDIGGGELPGYYEVVIRLKGPGDENKDQRELILYLFKVGL